MRVIEQGQENVVEGTQKVELRQSGYDAGTIELVPADDISPAVWTIKVTDLSASGPDADVSKSPDMTGKIKNGSERRLAFTDYLTAAQVAHWLKVQLSRKASPAPKVTVEDPDTHMTFTLPVKSTLTPFKRTDNECSAPEHFEAPAPPSRSTKS